MMSSRDPPRGSRDRQQQRIPSGPRPPSTAALATASSSRSHDTFMTAPSRGFTLDDIQNARLESDIHNTSPGYPMQASEDTRKDSGKGDYIDSQELMDSPISSPVAQSNSPDVLPVSLPSAKPPRAKPAPLRLNTRNLLAPSTSPKKPVSPGLQHWQQVRDHVMTPAEERAAYTLARGKEKKKTGLVSKAAERFGMKQAVEHVIRGDEKRKDTMAMKAEFGELSVEQRDEIARERRRFARDIKACLDACSAEESRRRLTRLSKTTGGGDIRTGRHSGHNAEVSGSSVHGSQLHPQRPTHDNDFYAFAPLLTELHRHMPAARAKKSWSRTCPHHAAILAELGAAFLDDTITTAGERQQALEVFGTVVRYWGADSAEEELSRWTWLCHVLIWDDRQLRDRGLTLLDELLRDKAMNGANEDRTHSATAFVNISVALIRLLHALETSSNRQDKHVDVVLNLIRRLKEGSMVGIDESTIPDLIGISSTEYHTGQSIISTELYWLAKGAATGTDISVTEWLVRAKGRNLQRFMPPPILHGTPPLVLQIRSHSLSTFLRSFASLLDRVSSARSNDIWQTAGQLLEPELTLVNITDELCFHWANFLLAFEIVQYGDYDDMDDAQSGDPFRIIVPTVETGRPISKAYRELLGRYWQMGGQWQEGLKQAAQIQIATSPSGQVYGMVRVFLASKPLNPLGHTCLQSLFTRLSSSPSSEGAKPFLRHLQSNHPQLLYKSLFACAAAISSPSLGPQLKLVLALSEIIGVARYWTDADPQMVAIVLMGNTGVHKGKGKEGEIPQLAVKLGRYAVLVQLLKALDAMERGAKVESRLKTFAEQLESRVAVMLEAEEVNARLPDDYRTLLCSLFFSLREVSGSAKKSSWRHIVIRWYLESEDRPTYRNSVSDSPLDELRVLLHGLTPQTPGPSTGPPTSRTTILALPKRKGTGMLSSGDRDPIFDIDLRDSLLPLLVLVQSTLTSDDWILLLSPLWSSLDQSAATPALAFLFMKCAEKNATAMHEVIMTDLESRDPTIRSGALRKIAKLYGWRYQILTQKTTTDRRGPVFQFTMPNLGYVTTEIGLPHWVQPQEVQDAALQKFGNTLPLELRQRLMELGWNEDEEMVGKSDWEHLPISSLPSLQMQADEEVNTRSPSPIRLNRSSSAGSGHSISFRRRKPLFAPSLTHLVGMQALLMTDETHSISAVTSRELVKLFQRDDAASLFRVLGEGFQNDITHALALIRAVSTTITPAYAYAAVNALVGHARAAVKSETPFLAHVDVLATIAITIRGLSGVSLRDIRKNRSEHVLLPASIHEDEGGYKLHAPWREGAVGAQTAQLLILGGILRNNPRDVYLIKKMLSNLQIQSSIHSLAFLRAWLLLIHQLFSTANRNYNDRAELRHFLSNVSAILRQHGREDLLVVAHSMRVFMLCSARFRRVYASVGFQSTMGSIYDTYSSEKPAIKDCIEYAMRSFYRIHGDSFVHLACVTISEGLADPHTLYDLLASLSVRNSTTSGVASGIRDMNKKEELEALVHMISGPELAFSEIGTAAAERHASKVASVNFEETVFPKSNIVKLFITVIAASPASPRAIRFLGLLSGMVPYIQDEPSRSLLQDSVEALGRIVVKGRASDDVALRGLAPLAEDKELDWVGAKAAYLTFADAYACSGGRLSNAAVKRVLHLVPELLKNHSGSTGSTAASIIGSLAKTYLSSARPAVFLRDIAPTFRTFMTAVDFSGLLDQITELIQNASFDLDTETTAVIIDHYVRPSIQILGSASEDNMAFLVPLRTSTVRLLSAAVFLRGDAWSTVEQTISTAGLLASVILPFSLMLEPPKQVDRDTVCSNLWIRMLHFILSKSGASAAVKQSQSTSALAARQVLVFQIIKIICVRAPDTISSNRGLWLYLAGRLEQMTSEADDRLVGHDARTQPRIIEWMRWTLYELLALHRSPLMLSFRHQIQSALSDVESRSSRSVSPVSVFQEDRTRGSSLSPSEATIHRSITGSRSISTASHQRVPSFQHESNIRNPRLSTASRARVSLSPGLGFGLGPGPDRLPQSRLASHTLRRNPNSDHSQLTADDSFSHPKRPSFNDISARQSSRPSFDAFQPNIPPRAGMNNRFPSSTTVRQLPTEKGGGAIVHLLGAPNQVSSALSGGMASPLLRARTPDGSRATCEVPLKTDELVAGVRRAVRATQIVFGYDLDLDEEEEPIRAWSVQDALHNISEQTRLFVEDEFGELFNPTSDEANTTMGYDLSFADTSGYTFKSKDDEDNDNDDDDDYDQEINVPILNIIPA